MLGLSLVVGLGLSIGWVGGGVIGVVLAVAAAVGSYIGLSQLARPRVARHYFPLRHALAEGETAAGADQGVDQDRVRAAAARDRE